MAGRRMRLVLWVLAALLIAGIIAVIVRERARPYESRPAAERPELLLLTSLPIVFPERFTLDSTASPVLEALQGRYRVTPISIADAASLGGHRLLFMVQPRAQAAEVLVQLDSWVRSGGRVLLLADPALQWPSERPLGDPIRPPFAFADTGLLAHWGLRLDAAETLETRELRAGRWTLRAAAPGTLVARGIACSVTNGGFLAHCAIGRGRVTVIADADFIDAERFGTPNLQLVFAELALLEK